MTHQKPFYSNQKNYLICLRTLALTTAIGLALTLDDLNLREI